MSDERIERVRAGLEFSQRGGTMTTEVQPSWSQLLADLISLQQELAGLRAEWNARPERWKSEQVDRLEKENASLQQENERLRGALRRIVADWDEWIEHGNARFNAANIARTALDQEVTAAGTAPE